MAHVPAAERRVQLIGAAIELMTREGVAAGTTRAVAAELGVAQATLHYVFGSKQELHRAVLTEITDSILDQVQKSAEPGRDFATAAGAWTAAVWETVQQQRDRYVLLFEFTAGSLRDPDLMNVVIAHNRNIEAIITGLISQAAAQAGQGLAHPAAALARFFLTGFDGIVIRFLTDGDTAAAATQLDHQLSATLALAADRNGFPPSR